MRQFWPSAVLARVGRGDDSGYSCGGTRTLPCPRGRLNVSDGQYAPAMAHFAVRLVHGPGWDSTRPIREQDGWDKHAAFMDGLVDEGFVILGGPVGNGEQTLHVVEAAGEQDVRTRLARDPWASARLLQIGVIEPWALWLDSRGLTHTG
jgi:uncharacterized protein YciI